MTGRPASSGRRRATLLSRSSQGPVTIIVDTREQEHVVDHAVPEEPQLIPILGVEGQLRSMGAHAASLEVVRCWALADDRLPKTENTL